MKSFFKTVMANIVAIVVMGIIFVIGLILLIAISAATSGSSSVNVKNNSVLTINLDRGVMETDREISPGFMDFTVKTPLKFTSILSAIRQAKNDDKIRAISIETDDTNAGITQLGDIRDAIEDFKKSGKPVYAFGNNVSQSAYYLSSVADKSYLDPAGQIELKGLSSEVVFYKDLLDKYGIGVDVVRHGKYKSAVEPFLTDKISEENKQQLTFLLGDIWKNISKKIEASRKIDSISFKTDVDSLYGVIPDLAVQHRLVDQLAQRSQYDNILKSVLKLPKDKDLNKVTLADYITTLDSNSKGKTDNQVAVLIASGEIFNGKAATGGIYSQNFIKEIQKLKKDDDVKAVVLRINSPGGSANASDEILYELQQLRAKKPLVVSMGDYAASGGYYIAMGAQRIFAEPNTVTGSIGVFGIIPNIKGLAAKNGLRSDVVETNTNSNMYSLINGLTPGGRNILQKSIEGTYKRFVYFVSKNRNKTFDQIDEVGGGHVWSGTRGKTLGLVDQLGNLTDAVNYVAGLAKIKDYSIQTYPKDKSNFEKFMQSLNTDSVANEVLEKKFGKESFRMMEDLSKLSERDRIQMQMPFRVSLD